MMKLLSKPQLQKYWQKMGMWVLPFLKGRYVATEQVFDGHSIYRRYADREQQHLIRVTSQAEIDTLAFQHTYSFHPYLSDKNDQHSWFVLDIDPKDNEVHFQQTKEVAELVAYWFQEHGYQFLLKFCGKNGFHFLWQWSGSKVPEQWYHLGQELIFQIVNDLYQTGATKTVVVLPTDQEHKREITTRWADQIGKQPVVYFDSKILHDFGNIRSPYSIHPATGWGSYPLRVSELADFKRGQATPKNILSADWSWVKMPSNRAK